MQLADIRALARHQYLRGVSVVELAAGDQRVRIRVPLASAASAAQAAALTPPAAASSTPAPTVVRADGLGLLRRTHPARLAPWIEAGDTVQAGQSLALLQVGGTYTAVCAPRDGVIEAVLAAEGQRIDHGTPLFRLRGLE